MNTATIRLVSCFILLLLFAAGPAGAVILVVNSAADNMTPDGQLTLREAIAAAVDDISVDGSPAGSGLDTIGFAPTLDGATIAWTQGELLVFTPLDGADILLTAESLPAGLTIDCQGLSRFMNVQQGAVMEFRNLTMTGGHAGVASPDGGLLYTSGCDLTFRNCKVSFNVSEGAGGAVFANGADRMRIIDSDFRNNQCVGDGGAFYYGSVTNQDLEITNSSIKHN